MLFYIHYRKKKKNKEKDLEAKVKRAMANDSDSYDGPSVQPDNQEESDNRRLQEINDALKNAIQKGGMTKAEAAYLARQQKRAAERILAKASKSHKQRVEEFNRHLDSLTEHYDIPKVSWTK